MDGDDPRGKEHWWRRPAPVSIAGVLLMGVIGSSLYDMAIKPGIGSVGKYFLTVVTLGSESIRNSVYASAALDPTSRAQITTLSVCVGIFSAFTIAAILIPGLRRKLNAEGAQGDAFRASSRRLRKHLIVLVLASTLMVNAITLMLSQSISIWRTYNANLKILAPHISDSERALLEARFASVKTKDEYVMLRGDMAAIAKAKGAELRVDDSW